MSKIGYARVSTDGQDLGAQREQLTAEGCASIYCEKISGARADRPQLRAMVKALKPGDVVVVTKLDRLARSTRDLLNVLKEIADAGATFKSLGDAWADTTTASGRLMLTVIGGLAEYERDLILSRTSEGRTRAMRNGVKFGRKPKLTDHQRQIVKQRKANGERTTVIARSQCQPHDDFEGAVKATGAAKAMACGPSARLSSGERPESGANRRPRALSNVP